MRSTLLCYVNKFYAREKTEKSRQRQQLNKTKFDTDKIFRAMSNENHESGQMSLDLEQINDHELQIKGNLGRNALKINKLK